MKDKVMFNFFSLLNESQNFFRCYVALLFSPSAHVPIPYSFDTLPKILGFTLVEKILKNCLQKYIMF